METKPKILIVDDEEAMLVAMEAVLLRLGHPVLKASNGTQALEVLAAEDVDMLISDMRMPQMTGDELLAEVKQKYPKLPVVMITAYGTIDQAVEAMRNGAQDFITKPFSAEDLERVVEQAFYVKSESRAQAKSSAQVSKDTKVIVTNDPSFKRVIEIAVSIAQSSASVLVQGESGTGKELIARLVHSSSGRSNQPFVAVNCAALPDNLLESELFGHEKGAFTGAVGTKIGKFELANGGTILLDEISEMDPLLQAKLLRVLQEREVDRVGGSKPIPIDVRVVATTNRDLTQSVTKGEFREDLYYRLNVIPLFVPPLRERHGDVRLLLQHFVRTVSPQVRIELNEALVAELEQYTWPGNVRELQNACERAVLLAGEGELKAEHFLLGSVKGGSSSEGDDELKLHSGLTVHEAERRLILETLRSTGNNKTKAAELLGISIRTLRNKLNEYSGDLVEVQNN